MIHKFILRSSKLKIIQNLLIEKKYFIKFISMELKVHIFYCILSCFIII